MKRKGIHKPTIEDVIELSGIEALHPGGFALTKRTAELAGLKPGIKVLDVSSGRGTQSIYYAQEFGVEVVGLDIAEEMVSTATEKAKNAGLDNLVSFKEEGHEYTLHIEGIHDKPISMTTLIHNYFNEFNADEVIFKNYPNWSNSKDSKYYGMSPDDIKLLWKKNGEEASQSGTQMHNQIELYMNNELETIPETNKR